jgi:hypothetical protein
MTDHDTETSDAGSEVNAWGTTEFRPGADVGLVARRTVGLVSRDNPSTRARLWELVSRDAPLDDILDDFSSTGLKALPDFGIVQVEGSGVRIVARGRTSVDVELEGGEHHQIDATDVLTWIEEVLTGVVSVTIALPVTDDDGGLDTSEGDVFAVLAGSVPAVALTRRFDRADPHAAQATGDAGWTATTRSDDVEVSTDSFSSLFEHTPSGPSTPPRPPASPPPSAPPSDLPPSASADFVSTAPPIASTIMIRGDAPAESPPPMASGDDRVHAVLAFSNGVRIDVDRSVLIGRNPKIAASVGSVVPHIMKFDGPGQGLSRNHAEVRIDDTQVVLEDLQSTNGTEIQLPGQPRRRLRSGEPVAIVPGSLIDFGDELQCTVESPA